MSIPLSAADPQVSRVAMATEPLWDSFVWRKVKKKIVEGEQVRDLSQLPDPLETENLQRTALCFGFCACTADCK